MARFSREQLPRLLVTSCRRKGDADPGATRPPQYNATPTHDQQTGHPMTHQQIIDLCGQYDFRDMSIDEHGREIVTVEVKARMLVLREEVDGSITGPLSEGEWVNLIAAEDRLLGVWCPVCKIWSHR